MAEGPPPEEALKTVEARVNKYLSDLVKEALVKHLNFINVSVHCVSPSQLFCFPNFLALRVDSNDEPKDKLKIMRFCSKLNMDQDPIGFATQQRTSRMYVMRDCVETMKMAQSLKFSSINFKDSKVKISLKLLGHIIRSYYY